MFSLTIALGSVTWQLLFNKREDADEAEKALYTGVSEKVAISDDFSQRFNARRMAISGSLLEDMDKSALARIEIGLHNTRMQIKGQQMAENDPAIKQARMRQNIGVISPMGGGPGMPGFGPNGRM